MFDLAGLRAAVTAQGPVVRVVIAGFKGSSPREVGAAMLVWRDGQSGTIGGGALEWQAMLQAREMLARATLAAGGLRVAHVPLGPALGQCCGGAVTLVFEGHSVETVAQLDAAVIARALDGSAMPLAVRRILDRARGRGILPPAGVVQGWLIEPVAHVQEQLWIWGAGHVGRALVAVLAPLPGLAITWVDVAAERFPETVAEGVTVVPAADPALLVAHVPQAAAHLVLTYSHALDLALCHGLLARGAARIGLIGSASKWARFRGRLTALGHGAAEIGRIECPIGMPHLGKHPQEIALGVAVQYIEKKRKNVTLGEMAI